MTSRPFHRVAPGALLAALLTSGCAAAVAATPPPPGPPNAVGMQPAVEHWFKRTEPQRIALENALQQAYDQLGSGTGHGCAELEAAADALLATLPTPKHTLDTLMSAGVAQIRTGAADCVAGDLSGARSSIAAGAAARATADDQLDEVLEAPNASVK